MDELDIAFDEIPVEEHHGEPTYTPSAPDPEMAEIGASSFVTPGIDDDDEERFDYPTMVDGMEQGGQ